VVNLTTLHVFMKIGQESCPENPIYVREVSTKNIHWHRLTMWSGMAKIYAEIRIRLYFLKNSVLKQKTPSEGYILGGNSPRGRSPRGEFTTKIYPSRGLFCFNPMPSIYMSKNRMLLWAKNYVFVSINSRDLVITELPEESTFCFDQSQCSIDARRWIN